MLGKKRLTENYISPRKSLFRFLWAMMLGVA